MMVQIAHKILYILVFAAAVFAFSVLPHSIYAQQPVLSSGVEEDVSPQDKIDPNRLPSLLFTFWEHSAIQDAVQDAKNSRGVVRAPTDREISRAEQEDLEPLPKPPPEKRNIKLGGILYTTGDEWTIWLNGQRVTPDALPEEVLDLKVYNEYIEMKWFDEYTKQIFPIRLRPHQRFNIDTRIFLPG